MDLFKIQDPPTTAGRAHQSSSSCDLAGSKAERKEPGLGMTFQVTPSHLLPLPTFLKLLQPPKILPPDRIKHVTHKLLKGISSCPWLPRVHDNLLVPNELLAPRVIVPTLLTRTNAECCYLQHPGVHIAAWCLPSELHTSCLRGLPRCPMLSTQPPNLLCEIWLEVSMTLKPGSHG